MTAFTQGSIVTQGALGSEQESQELRDALDAAFGYRGDVTIVTRDGRKVEGYVFDKTSAPRLEESTVRLLTATSEDRVTVRYSEIASLEFTGRDTAAGKSWESWLRRYAAKKSAGEVASIESDSGE